MVVEVELGGERRMWFCSSGRRHTGYWRDWSSDVCSSDLPCAPLVWVRRGLRARWSKGPGPGGSATRWVRCAVGAVGSALARSGEGRVGEEWRFLRALYYYKKLFSLYLFLYSFLTNSIICL